MKSKNNVEWKNSSGFFGISLYSRKYCKHNAITKKTQCEWQIVNRVAQEIAERKCEREVKIKLTTVQFDYPMSFF